MDDDEYFNSLVSRASTDVGSSWQDCVDGFKKADVEMGSAFHRKLEWMNKAADIYLSDNNKMAGFVGKFAEDCGIGEDYGSRLNRIRKTFPPCTAENFSHDTLDILLSTPEELREDIVSSDKPVTVTEVQQAKAGYKEVQENPDYSDLKEEIKEKRKTPVEAAKEAWGRREKQKEAINNTVAPDVIDLDAIARSKKETDIRSVGPAFVGLMETLCTKFDEKDIKRELVAFMHPDPLGLKAEALHKMADILNDLREDFSIETAKQQLN